MKERRRVSGAIFGYSTYLWTYNSLALAGVKFGNRTPINFKIVSSTTNASLTMTQTNRSSNAKKVEEDLEALKDSSPLSTTR